MIDSIINKWYADAYLDKRQSPLKHTSIYIDHKRSTLYLTERTLIPDELRVIEQHLIFKELGTGLIRYENKRI